MFVLAVDGDELAHSVKALYGNDFDAQGYLRRFFDLDFRLPAPERRAFIDSQLQATGIYGYFGHAADPKSYSGRIHAPNATARWRTGYTLLSMLFLFFGASDLSLRTVGQAIRRLGLLYASLGSDEVDHGEATTVALIIRTIDPKLYERFVAGEATDGDVVNAIFERPGLKVLRYDSPVVSFEAAVILAGLEDKIATAPPDALNSPLWDRYRNCDRTDHELFGDEEGGTGARRAETRHAKEVAGIVEDMIQRGRGVIGFGLAVRRLELLSASPIDRPAPPAP